MRGRRGLILAAALVACSSPPSAPPDPGFDAYLGSKRVETAATGFFRVERIGAQWWLVTPLGHPFFSVGVNVLHVDGTPTRDGVSHYRQAALADGGTALGWAEAQVARCQAWGFNTVGAWSQWELFRGKLPYTVIFDVGEAQDYFSDDWARSVAESLAPRVAPLRADPFLVGYFLNNEMYWGFGVRGFEHMLARYMALPADAPGKARLVDFLRQRYGSLAALGVDFDVQATSWDALVASTTLAPRPTSAAAETGAVFAGVVAERFFGVTDAALRAGDPNHLNLGVRFISQLLPRRVLQAAARYVDVVSINFYELLPGVADVVQAWEPDYLPVTDFLRAHAEAIDKPILITEWSYRAADSVPRNTYPPIYPTLPTQAERADAFEAYYRNVLARPWFVGHHWFLWADQPAEGRFDGEDSNFGLVSEADQPYARLVERAKALYREIYTRLP